MKETECSVKCKIPDFCYTVHGCGRVYPGGVRTRIIVKKSSPTRSLRLSNHRHVPPLYLHYDRYTNKSDSNRLPKSSVYSKSPAVCDDGCKCANWVLCDGPDFAEWRHNGRPDAISAHCKTVGRWTIKCNDHSSGGGDRH
ncbi:hypothetical protein CEXT_56731 [Caerostris extrusa]|uniref:Uncharacterized protein n=1 Tax=Caerostris extrusa TaxID=172846 RepID=A0AAV4TV48_CAEEX|nr:hypothetical protein CEXT_56731 [Caerostris extrusa]